VATKAAAGEVQNDKQQDQDEGNDSKHLHPTRRPASAVRRSTSTSQTSKRSCSPGTNVISPAT
jgi:hypothetical protein